MFSPRASSFRITGPNSLSEEAQLKHNYFHRITNGLLILNFAIGFDWKDRMLCHCYVFFCRHRHKRFDDSENIAQPFSCYSYCLASAAHSDLLVCFACHNRSQTHRKFLSSSVTPQRYQVCARVACFFRGFAPGSQAGRSICYRDVKTTALCAFLDLASPWTLCQVRVTRVTYCGLVWSCRSGFTLSL